MHEIAGLRLFEPTSPQAATEIAEPSAEVQEASLRRVMVLADVADVCGCGWLLRG